MVTPDWAALQRSVRRLAGAGAFDTWRAAFPIPTDPTTDDLRELLTEQGLNTALTAAVILEALADPTREISFRADGGETAIDRRGQVKAWLEKAASLRLSAFVSGGGRRLAAPRFGGSGVPSFVRNDSLENGTVPDEFAPPGGGRAP